MNIKFLNLHQQRTAYIPCNHPQAKRKLINFTDYLQLLNNNNSPIKTFEKAHLYAQDGNSTELLQCTQNAKHNVQVLH